MGGTNPVILSHEHFPTTGTRMFGQGLAQTTYHITPSTHNDRYIESSLFLIGSYKFETVPGFVIKLVVWFCTRSTEDPGFTRIGHSLGEAGVAIWSGRDWPRSRAERRTEVTICF
jgi:hypothetical protein